MANNRRALSGDVECKITIEGDMNVPKEYYSEPDTEMSDISTNAVQNKVIKAYIDEAVAEIWERINQE